MNDFPDRTATALPAPSGEFVGQSLPMPEDDHEQHKELEEDLRRGKTFLNFETVCIRKNGTLFRVSISGVSLFGESGELTSVVGMIVDAEQVPTGGLAYEHVLVLADSSTDFLLHLDRGLRFIYLNPDSIQSRVVPRRARATSRPSPRRGGAGLWVRISPGSTSCVVSTDLSA